MRRAIEDGRYRLRSLLLSETARRDLEPVLGRLAEDVPIYICAVRDFADHHRLRHSPRAVWRWYAGQRLCRWRACWTRRASWSYSKPWRTPTTWAACSATPQPSAPMPCCSAHRAAIRCTGRRSAPRWRQRCRCRSRAWRTGRAGSRRSSARGFTIVGLTPRASAQSLDRFAATRPARVALLVGNEGLGLSREAEAGGTSPRARPDSPGRRFPEPRGRDGHRAVKIDEPRRSLTQTVDS